MKRSIYLSLVFLFFIMKTSFCQTFDIQGHRGCRGLMPENSIPGFIKAIDLGVATLELDVVISADGKVVVSHDPYISSQFCANELGMEMKKKEGKGIIIYKLDYGDIRLFDCGINGNDRFPEQQKISVYKPLLSEVFEHCEKYIRNSQKEPIKYSIELKSSPSGDGLYHPEPRLFTELVYNVIKKNIPSERICIQSFDMRILQFWRLKYPEHKLSLLISNSKSSAKNIEKLGFIPDFYSPNLKLINLKEVEELHSKSVKIIPWTVNESKDMKKLVDMGVDGFITDYPNRYFDNFPTDK